MPEIDSPLPLPKRNDDVLNYLRVRGSNKAKMMDGSLPGPDASELADLLEIAARVPDHRKLNPWRFITFTGKAREDFGKHLGAIFAKDNPDMPVDRVLFESGRFLRAATVVAVISSPVECTRGTAKWEQELSCGALCYNLLIAAQNSGWGAQWLTEWYAYHAGIDRVLGLTEGERVAGYIYIGTAEQKPLERKRPDMPEITQRWQDVRPSDGA